MSDANKETIADIIAEISNYRDPVVRERRLDVRLKAAYERELAAGGDAAKLREALTDAEKTLYDSSRSMYGIPPHLHDLLARIRAALAAPPRNCDVGTPDEQVERWNNENPYPYEWDDRQYLDTREVLKWAQMPYEAQEGVVK